MNTLKKKVVDASNEDWDEHLPAALYAYRISKQASSKFTPFFLMYNRNPRKAVNFEVERGEGDEDGDVMIEEEDGDTEEILAKMLEIREWCHSKAKENIAAAQDKHKKQYDAKHNSLKVSLRWYYPNRSNVLPFFMYYMILSTLTFWYRSIQLVVVSCSKTWCTPIVWGERWTVYGKGHTLLKRSLGKVGNS